MARKARVLRQLQPSPLPRIVHLYQGHLLQMRRHQKHRHQIRQRHRRLHAEEVNIIGRHASMSRRARRTQNRRRLLRMVPFREIMPRYHFTTPCHDVVSRHHVTMSFHDTMPRCHFTTPCHDVVSRYHFTTPCHDIISRHHVTMSFHDIMPRYHVTTPFASRHQVATQSIALWGEI